MLNRLAVISLGLGLAGCAGYGDKLKSTVAAQSGRYKDRLIVFANIDFKDLDAPGYPGRRRRRR